MIEKIRYFSSLFEVEIYPKVYVGYLGLIFLGIYFVLSLVVVLIDHPEDGQAKHVVETVDKIDEKVEKLLKKLQVK